MRMWAKGAAGATLLTASFVAFGAGPAIADVTNGNGSVLGGNQVNAPISIPVDVSGNAVAVLGGALAGSKGGASVHNMDGEGGDNRTSGRGSIGGGNQLNAPINAPINACGNSVALIGHALSGCEGGAKVHTSAYGGGHSRTNGSGSVLGGNQVNAPISAPINICGNAAAVLGDALAGCKGGAKVHTAAYGEGGHSVTDGRGSVGGGNQVHAPVNAPIDVCGNAAAVVGHALAGCRGSVGTGGYAGGYYGGFHGRTSGRGSVGGGNQVHAPVNAPVDVCGNAAAVIGRALGSCGADQGGYSGGYGDDCIEPSSARMSGNGSGLPQLPVSVGSLGNGALPVAMGASPALPRLSGREVAPQSAQNGNPLDGLLRVPPVGGPPKQLPPVGLTSADSSTGSPNGALLALALGGMFAATAGTVTVARRLGRRSSR